MNYIIHYDVAALLITLIIIAQYYSNRRISLGVRKVFVVMLMIAAGSNALDLITVYTIEHPQSIPLWLNYLVNMVYLLSFNCVPMLYYVYVREAIRPSERWSRWEYVKAFGMFAVDALLIFTTPITKGIFYFENGLYYKHGSWMAFLYVSAFYYMVSALIQTIRYQSKLTRSQRFVVVFYSVGTIVSIVFQLVCSGLLIVQFAISLALLLVYLSLENPEDFTDAQIGSFNRLAFSETISSYLRTEKDFEIMGVQIGGIGYLRSVIGLTNINGLMKMIADFLESISGRRRKVFYVEQNRFMILVEGSDAHWDMFREVLQRRFQRPFTFEGTDFSLDLAMTLLPNKEHQGISDAEDIIRMLECSLQEAEESGAEMIVISGEQLLEKGRRESEILHILREALRYQRFEVYYQPIYSVKKKCYCSAEALIRLRDETMGYISPEEFVPIAERHGLIIEMGTFVFREVCSFIAKKRLWERGIEYVDVNLSVVQCMQEDLHERLIAIMDEFHLPYHCINLEITETAAVLSSENLRGNMTKLMEKGVNFSLDDYGTGFSNTASIIEYPFHTIKLDKSMLWSATDSEKAMCALEHVIAMIKSMHMELICEGVETQSQATMLEHMGCDYFQGYYFSKPVNAEGFLDLLARDRAYSLLEEV
ncbi:MAG: EAL domain-containing protein [Eubacterium sp.]|nr:EAL domain-containing protein [Eubacterium sp.]